MKDEYWDYTYELNRGEIGIGWEYVEYRLILKEIRSEYISRIEELFDQEVWYSIHDLYNLRD